MISTRISLRVFGIMGVLLIALPSFFVLRGQGISSRELNVRYNRHNITVTIMKPLPLPRVLDEVCKQTEAECEGLAKAERFQVAPMSMTGSWGEIVQSLLNGTGLDYVASPPDLSQGGRILIQDASSAAAEANRNNPLPQPELVTPSQVVAVQSASSQTVQNQDDIDSGTSSLNASLPPTMPGSNSSSIGAGAAPSPSVNGSPLTSEVIRDSSANEPAGFLPFPDGRGNLIPVSHGVAEYLPFPDGNGNLIPVKPTEPGSPFPLLPVADH